MPMMTGARAFAEMLRGYGVDHVFFVPAILAKALAEMEDMAILRVMVHGEKAAAYMADGYARAAGRPGVCMAQHIGASNLAAGLRDAYMAGSPVIAVTGGYSAESRYRHTYQEIEDFPQWAPVTKFNGRADSVTRIPDMLRQAFRIATTGAPGPVHLELAVRGGHMAEEQADLEPLVEPQFAQVPAFRPPPEPERIRAAAAVLAQAARPVIVAGGGVIRSRAERELLALAEKLQMPVATTLNAKAVMPDRHPLAVGVPGSYSRACANAVLKEADLVFFAGSRAGGMATHNGQFPPRGTRVVQLDIDPWELGRNYPNAASILGDAKVALAALLDVVERRPLDAVKPWLARTQQLVADWRASEEGNRSSDAVPLRPERICKAISETLPDDGVLVSDTGHSGIWTGTMVELRSTTQRYFRCAGSLGWGFPGALGVKCALPERPVLCFTGDGGFYYHLAELETARRYGINLVVLVNNNSSLNQEITLNEVAYGGKPRGRWTDMWTFTDNDFARIAESFGVTGLRVERPGDLAEALSAAYAMGKPVVIDAVSDRNVLAKRVPH